MNGVFIESKINDAVSQISIEAFLIEIFGTIKKTEKAHAKKPAWVKKLQELLWEEHIDYSLKQLGLILDIHPIHLSREFNRYFGTSFGNYIRLLKLNKAFYLITSEKFSMTEIGYRCGFYDQSHFISNFKRVYNTTPTKILRTTR